MTKLLIGIVFLSTFTVFAHNHCVEVNLSHSSYYKSVMEGDRDVQKGRFEPSYYFKLNKDACQFNRFLNLDKGDGTVDKLQLTKSFDLPRFGCTRSGSDLEITLTTFGDNFGNIRAKNQLNISLSELSVEVSYIKCNKLVKGNIH
jgi:hypothetical protein